MMKYEASLVLNQYIQSQQYFPVFAKLGATYRRAHCFSTFGFYDAMNNG